MGKLKALHQALKKLDMSKVARMKRAKDMGFDTNKVWYHGTADDIASFDPVQFGKATDANSAKQGIWLVDRPQTASGYADNAASLDVKRALADAERYADAGDWDAYEAAIVRAENLDLKGDRAQGQNIMQLMSRGTFREVDMTGTPWDAATWEMNDAIASAKRDGADGVYFKNLRDNASAFDKGEANHLVVFDPENVRSTNAAFDPEKSGSSNILAGMAPVGLLGALGAKELGAGDYAAAVGHGAASLPRMMLGEGLKAGGYLSSLVGAEDPNAVEGNVNAMMSRIPTLMNPDEDTQRAQQNIMQGVARQFQGDQSFTSLMNMAAPYYQRVPKGVRGLLESL